MGFDAILLIATLSALAVGLWRIRRLERTVALLQRRLDANDGPVAVAGGVAETDLTDVFAQDAGWPSPAPVAVPETPAADVRPPRGGGLETVIGGKLPIWVGGAALVVAGFFLVRLGIESGLFGPTARVVAAALFSIALIVGGELARRLPAVRDDARIGQVLSGAGIASAYGTLYIAAAQYHLVGAAAAFVVMVAITALALALSLRHGPPTAIMALAGGFSAPLLAGSDAPELGLLLSYLAVFITALFALAAHRGWRWLAVAALVAGFGWSNLLLLMLSGRDAGGIAAFVVALAIGGMLALPRAGTAATWLRVAPLVAGLVQLIVLAPALDFGAIAWTFHLVLAGAALVLARRDPVLRPAAVAAACLVTVLVAIGLASPDHGVTPLAAAIGAALFAASGIAFSRQSPSWATVALIGLAGPLLAAHLVAPDLLPAVGWGALELATAAAAALLAWRHRDATNLRDVALVGGTAVAALLAGVGLATIAGSAWAPLAVSLVLLAAGGWADRIGDRDVARIPALILIAIAVLAAGPIAAFVNVLASSVVGATLPYPLLPPLADIVRAIALPALAAAALFARPRPYGALRARIAGALAVVAVAVAYAVSKQPLAIADAAAFVRHGFVERAVITLAFAAAGWALAIRTQFRRAGTALIALAVARLVWFDIGLLSPLIVPQRVGPIPLLNAAVLLPALLALATTALGGRWRAVGLALTLLAALAAVRQIAHGSDLSGPLGSTETWGYSAILLLVAILWLWRGLRTGSRPLRLAALALLTVVTVKVFLFDVAALGGLLRILSLLGLGLALIAIGWAYTRLTAVQPRP